MVYSPVFSIILVFVVKYTMENQPKIWKKWSILYAWFAREKTTLAWKGYPFYEKRFKKTIVYQGKKLKIYQKRPIISDKKFEKCSILYLQLRWKSTFRELFQLFWAIINGVFSGFLINLAFLVKYTLENQPKESKKWSIL